MKLRNVTVVTTTMSVGAPYSEAVALRGLVPLHVPLQQRLPVFDGVVDLVRCGRAVNRWIPVTMMEFLLFDVDRVLRGGGYLWIDRFFSKGVDLEKLYAPLIGKLGYKKFDICCKKIKICRSEGKLFRFLCSENVDGVTQLHAHCDDESSKCCKMINIGR
ncbi:hypothetical protein AHAS_Ahas13G0495100 [Arachis hypogaea]